MESVQFPEISTLWMWTSCSYAIPIFEASIQSCKKRNEIMLFEVIKSGTKKNVYKNASSHALKLHLKLLLFIFKTSESNASVLGNLKEKRMISLIFSFNTNGGGSVGHRISVIMTLSVGNIDMWVTTKPLLGILIINLGKNSICAWYCKQIRISFARIKQE